MSLLLTALLPLLFVAAIIYFNSKSTLIRVAQENLDRSAKTFVQSVVNAVGSAYAEVESWSRLDTLQAVFTGDDVDLRLGLLLRDLRDTSDFIQIWCVDTRGRVIASSDFSEAGSYRDDHPAVLAALENQPYVSPVQEFHGSGSDVSWIVVMSHPIVGAFDEETTIGALVATYDWDQVIDLLRSQSLAQDEDTQRVMLFDDRNRVIAALDESLMLRAPDPAPSDLDKAIADVTAILDDGPTIKGISSSRDERFGLHYTAIAAVQEHAVLSSIRRLELNILIVCLLATVGVVVVSIVLSRSIGAPIVRLSETARDIAQGNLQAREVYQSTDEIGTLASDLEVMRRNLKRHIDGLDSAVQARTEELETTIRRLREEISERINAERQTKLHQQQLVQADKMVSLGILVSGMAHEINNPNALIGLNIPVIQAAWEKAIPVLDEYCEEHGDISLGAMSYSELRDHIPGLLTEMREASDRIRAIVSDLKAFSRKHDEAEFEATDLNQVVESAVGLVKKHIDKCTDSFSMVLAPGLPAIHGDHQRIEQVLINLLLNACDALTNRKQRINIETMPGPDGADVRIVVSDEGCGIEPRDLQHVTDPFFTTKRASGGTGLGLSISSGIVDEHGGTLRFDSAPGRGTIVELSLPVTQVAPARSS